MAQVQQAIHVGVGEVAKKLALGGILACRTHTRQTNNFGVSCNTPGFKSCFQDVICNLACKARMSHQV